MYNGFTQEELRKLLVGNRVLVTHSAPQQEGEQTTTRETMIQEHEGDCIGVYGMPGTNLFEVVFSSRESGARFQFYPMKTSDDSVMGPVSKEVPDTRCFKVLPTK